MYRGPTGIEPATSSTQRKNHTARPRTPTIFYMNLFIIDFLFHQSEFTVLYIVLDSIIGGELNLHSKTTHELCKSMSVSLINSIFRRNVTRLL